MTPRDTDSQRYLKAEEQKLIEFTRQATEKRKQAEEKRKKEALPVFEIQEGQTVADQALSPDGEHVFLLVNERPTGAKNADTPNYVTESAYSEMIPGRSNVGDAQGRRRLAVLNLKTGRTVWADAAFAGKRQAVQPSAQGDDRKEVDREVNWSMPLFSRDGRLAVAWGRAADFKDRWIVASIRRAASRGSSTRFATTPGCSSGGFGAGNAGFLPDQKQLYFTAEKDGWMHLHVVDASQPDARPRALTSGRFEVSSVSLSGDRKRFYFTSSERHPGERHLYSLPIDGGERTELTSMTGAHAGDVSPDDQMLGILHSYSNKPPGGVPRCRTRRERRRGRSRRRRPRSGGRSSGSIRR